MDELQRFTLTDRVVRSGLVRHVPGDDQCLAAGVLDRLARLGQPLLGAADDGDPGADGGQGAAGPDAHTTGAAGDDGDPVAEGEALQFVRADLRHGVRDLRDRDGGGVDVSGRERAWR